MSGPVPPRLLLAVLQECVTKFGPAKTREQVTQQSAYVRRRMAEIRNGTGQVEPYAPRGFDAKAAAAGDRE